jgi:hypothetical protein
MPTAPFLWAACSARAFAFRQSRFDFGTIKLVEPVDVEIRPCGIFRGCFGDIRVSLLLSEVVFPSSFSDV